MRASNEPEEEPLTTDVVILGGGLAGVACARTLGEEGVSVTLVDRNDYNQFQPLLYQVATSQLPAEDIARPLRAIVADLPTVDVVVADVVSVRLSDRTGEPIVALAVHPCPLASSVQSIIVRAVTPDHAEGRRYHALPTDDPLRALNILREAAGLPPRSDEHDN